MITVRMSGGLGNQMFQYALYKHLLLLGREACIDDVTEYEHQAETGVRRPLLLEKAFGITYARAEEVGSLRSSLLKRKPAELHDKDFVFDARFLRRTEGYFCGCFQSARYFEDCAEEIRKAYTFPPALYESTETMRRFGKLIREAKAPVSIHLRFGDYLDKAEVYGGICTDAYYARAIALMRERTKGPTFFVFSNDVDRAGRWIGEQIEKHVLRADEVTLVYGHEEEEGYKDLALMALCRHHVLANSSFSWWAAWLAEEKDKVVAAPSYWIRSAEGKELRGTDIYTRDMIRISPEGRTILDAPKLSVIVAAYNIEDYIGRALNALRAQTYANLEILVVDDGSTDSTGGICDAFAALDRRIRVIHKENGGLSDARNAGLAAATGDYIGFLDGDDWIHPLLYEGLLSACLYADAAVGVTRYQQVRQEESEEDETESDAETTLSRGHRVSVDRLLRRSTVLSRAEALSRYVTEDERLVIYNSVWSKLFRRDAVEGLVFPKGRNSEDILYTTKALCAAEKTVYLDEALYYYVVDRAGSIMNEKLGERRKNDEIPFWKERIAFLREQGEEELADKAAYALYRRLLYYDLEFRATPGMEDYAAWLEETVAADREEIRRIYERDDVRRGDRKRMELFLKSPAQYAKWAARYERFVVPVKQKLRGKRRQSGR